LVVIPVREIESWLLVDERSLVSVFGLKKTPKNYKNPEILQDLKKEISEIVKKLRKNPHTAYCNATDNIKIARSIPLTKLKKCSSFLPLDDFINKNILKN